MSEYLSQNEETMTIKLDNHNVIIYRPNEIKKIALDILITVLKELEQQREILNDDIEFYPSRYFSVDESIYIAEIKTKRQKGDPRVNSRGLVTFYDGLCRPLEPKYYSPYFVQLELCPDYKYSVTTIRVNIYKKQIEGGE